MAQDKTLTELRLKIAMLGLWGAGKTSLVSQFVNQQFSDKYHATLGVKTDTKTVVVDDQSVKMVLWDIAGAEENFSVPMHYVSGSAGYLLVLDGTRVDSVQRSLELINEVETQLGKLPYTIVVNKSDLDWELGRTELTGLLTGQLGSDATWLHTSAKTGENVEAAFSDLAKKIIA